MPPRVLAAQGDLDFWEHRVKRLLDERPFRISGHTTASDIREFVVEYRNFAGLAVAFVHVALMPSGGDGTRIECRGEALEENPVRAMFSGPRRQGRTEGGRAVARSVALRTD
jgi:hypothetical protein